MRTTQITERLPSAAMPQPLYVAAMNRAAYSKVLLSPGELSGSGTEFELRKSIGNYGDAHTLSN